MSNERVARAMYDRPRIYQIRVQGHLGEPWSDWFLGMTISLEDHGETLLTGEIVDQAALYGLLRKVRDLGMPLLSVHCLPSITQERTNQ